MVFSVKTDKGPVRESNQDDFSFGVTSGIPWAVVCDGMGGVNGGQIASAICVRKISERLKKGIRSKMNYTSVKNLLETAVQAANAEIFAEAEGKDELHGMGTTVVAVVVLSNIAVIAHVGDSRIYEITPEKITRLTKDHSVVQVLIDSGRLSPELAKSHPDRNIITRAVGVNVALDVETDVVDFTDGTTFLLCTDGLSGALDESDILNTVNNSEFAETADKLVSLAIENGAADNVTAVLMTCEE